MEFDAFICHASEDKEDFVRPLAEQLKMHNMQIWYDEFELKVGDSLSEKIDHGLKSSKYGIVVLSKHFFSKPWAKRELQGLIARETFEDEAVIIPIWHRIDISDVMAFSPSLADKVAGTSANGINSLIRELTRKLKPDCSPLIVARDHLENLNIDAPPISDEWWLDLIEYKEFLKYPDINAGKRWIFPLPYPYDDNGRERGLNIAATAMQLDWSFEGEELNISPITHPHKIHEFIDRWPGFRDYCREYPAVLAMYAPQLTIHGFDNGFTDVFDELLRDQNVGNEMYFSYGSHYTIDGRPALCRDIIALRHKSFGNYRPEDLGRWYFDIHSSEYIRSDYSVFDGLVWLVSSDSDWLPRRIRSTLLNGILDDGHSWTHSVFSKCEDSFILALSDKQLNEDAFPAVVKDVLMECIYNSISTLKIHGDCSQIAETLIGHEIIEKYRLRKEKHSR